MQSVRCLRKSVSLLQAAAGINTAGHGILQAGRWPGSGRGCHTCRDADRVARHGAAGQPGSALGSAGRCRLSAGRATAGLWPGSVPGHRRPRHCHRDRERE